MTARVAILGTAAVVAIAAVLMPTVRAPGPSTPPADDPTVSRAPSSPHDRDPHGRGADARDREALRRDGQLPTTALRRRRRAALDTVRSFLDAYLPIEVGELTAGRRRAIAATTTAQLGARLLTGPRRDSGGPSRRGEVVGMTGEFDKPPSTFAARVLIERDGIASELGLIVVRRGGRWLIADMTE